MAKKLMEEKHDLIMAHILDPEHSPLDPKMQEQLDRVIQATRLLDRHPDKSQVVRLLQTKYRIGRNTAYEDIRIARELYKQENQIDFDFWKTWQIKDLVSIIMNCKLSGKEKEAVAAHKVLNMVLGDRPIEEDDPHRAEKTNIYIQMNELKVPIDALAKLGIKDREQVAQSIYPDIDDAEAEEIMNS